MASLNLTIAESRYNDSKGFKHSLIQDKEGNTQELQLCSSRKHLLTLQWGIPE